MGLFLGPPCTKLWGRFLLCAHLCEERCTHNCGSTCPPSPSPSELTTHSNSTPQRPRFNGSVEAFFNSDDPQRHCKWPPCSFWICCFHNLTETLASNKMGPRVFFPRRGSHPTIMWWAQGGYRWVGKSCNSGNYPSYCEYEPHLINYTLYLDHTLYDTSFWKSTS